MFYYYFLIYFLLLILFLMYLFSVPYREQLAQEVAQLQGMVQHLEQEARQWEVTERMCNLCQGDSSRDRSRETETDTSEMRDAENMLLNQTETDVANNVRLNVPAIIRA